MDKYIDKWPVNTDPIIIIDDSEGEQELVRIAFAELNIKNKLFFFKDGLLFLDYIKAEKAGTFFILSDVNMPNISGLEIKQKIQEDENLRLKCIPFYFFLQVRPPWL